MQKYKSKLQNINAKTRTPFQDTKILTNMHILVRNQNFEKIKKLNSKIPILKFFLAVNKICQKVLIENKG
jgi:hypothetical protein